MYSALEIGNVIPAVKCCLHFSPHSCFRIIHGAVASDGTAQAVAGNFVCGLPLPRQLCGKAIMLVCVGGAAILAFHFPIHFGLVCEPDTCIIQRLAKERLTSPSSFVLVLTCDATGKEVPTVQLFAGGAGSTFD